MLLLKTLTIVLGVLVAGSRGVCLASRAMSRRLMKGFLDRPLFVNVLGLFAALFGVSLFWVTRRAIWGLGDVSLVTGFWGMLIGAVVCVAGLVVLVRPVLFTGMLGTLMGKPDQTLRVLMGIGLVVGLAILCLGIWGYSPAGS